MARAVMRSDDISMMTHARLLNWGRCYRVDDTLQKLNIKSKSSFVSAASKNAVVDENDAELIEKTVTQLAQMSTVARIQAFALKLYYAERPEEYTPRFEDLGEDLGRKFPRCGSSGRTFRRYLKIGRLMVERWAPDIT